MRNLESSGPYHVFLGPAYRLFFEEIQKAFLGHNRVHADFIDLGYVLGLASRGG